MRAPTLPSQPAQSGHEPGALITRRDFEILKEGAGGREHAGRRDVCLGVFLSSVAGVVACFLVADSVTEWWIGSVMFLGVVAGVTAILAWVFHKMSKSAGGRQSYRDTCAAIEAALPPRIRVEPVPAVTLAAVRVDVTQGTPAVDAGASEALPDQTQPVAEPMESRRAG